MKTVEKVINPRKRAGEQSPGKIYDEKLKVRARREWRGLKDTLYDYTRWLYLISVLARFIVVPRNIKGFFRYRWMMSYLFVPHGMDKFTVGLRDEALRIAHTSFNFVISDVTQAIANCFRGDRRVGNDKAYSDKCVITDENSMVTFMMGFDTDKVHTILREVPTMFASNIFHQFNVMHYLDVAQLNGLPGDVCPMPEAEAGVSIDDDFCVLGCCAVQNNTTCDGSLMGNGIIAKRLEREYGIPTFQLATPLRHKEPDVLEYAADQIKQAIAFVEEHTGEKWDWDTYFAAAKRVNYATKCRIAQMEINSTPYPQFFGAAFSLYNDTNYMGNSGRMPAFVEIDRKLLKLAQKGYKAKRMYAKEYRHRAIVWGVQPQYVIDMLYWMVQCWGVVPLTDMLSHAEHGDDHAQPHPRRLQGAAGRSVGAVREDERRHRHDVGAYVLQGAHRHARHVRGAGPGAGHPHHVGLPRPLRSPRLHPQRHPRPGEQLYAHRHAGGTAGPVAGAYPRRRGILRKGAASDEETLESSPDPAGDRAGLFCGDLHHLYLQSGHESYLSAGPASGEVVRPAGAQAVSLRV